MALTLTREDAPARAKLAVIDCDIHNELASQEALLPYLPKEWRDYTKQFGNFGFSATVYPRNNMNAARTDAWPPNGKRPGSDLPFLREQLLDAWGIEYGVLNCLSAAGARRLDQAAAIAQAMNEWEVAEWLDPEPRLRGSIMVPHEDGAAAAAEIDRAAKDKRFIQVIITIRTMEPLGRRKYWPMFEAAVRNDLPIGIHFGGSGGHAYSGAGWQSHYIEDHAGMSQSFQPQVVSLITEGVFERFPTLKIVLIEGGFAWVPPLLWRLDSAWKRLRAEVPHLKRLPSEYFREHFYLTTQPMEEPARPQHFHQLLEQLDMNDKLLFATDYPHWDFDAPDQAFPVRIDRDLERDIMAENARRLYRL
jgi:uncharacterized protein